MPPVIQAACTILETDFKGIIIGVNDIVDHVLIEFLIAREYGIIEILVPVVFECFVIFGPSVQQINLHIIN